MIFAVCILKYDDDDNDECWAVNFCEIVVKSQCR